MAWTVSIIIPAYNAARTVSRALDSALAQTRPPDELIVVDDGSTDDFDGALRTYADRVVIVRQEQLGAAAARNAGIVKARGSIIGFLDADDYWEPAKLERQLEVFDAHPAAGIVASAFFRVRPDRACREVRNKCVGWSDKMLPSTAPEAFEAATRIWTSTVIVRRDVLGNLRFEPGLEPAEDRDLWFRIARAAPAYIISEPLATQVISPNSLSRRSVDGDCSSMLRVVRKYAGCLGPKCRRHWEANIYRRWAATCLGRGRSLAAMRAASKAVVTSPGASDGWLLLFKSVLTFLRLSEPARSARRWLS